MLCMHDSYALTSERPVYAKKKVIIGISLYSQINTSVMSQAHNSEFHIFIAHCFVSLP